MARRDQQFAELLRVVAVTGVIGAIVVSTQPVEIDLVQYDTQQIIVDTAGCIERAFHDVNLRFAPFNDKEVRVDEVSGCANIHHGSERREIDNHVIVAFPQAGE